MNISMESFLPGNSIKVFILGGKLIEVSFIDGSLAKTFTDMNSPANNVKNLFMVKSPFAKKYTLMNRKVNFLKEKTGLFNYI